MNLLDLIRRDLVATLGRLRHPAAQHIARTASSPAAWCIILADLGTRTTTREQHLAAAAERAVDALSRHDVEGAARHLATVCGLSVMAWAEAVERETPAMEVITC